MGLGKFWTPSAINFNNLLDDFTLVGTALVPLGALMFCVILIIPVCRSSPSHKKGQYVKAPTDESSAANLATENKSTGKCVDRFRGHSLAQ